MCGICGFYGFRDDALLGQMGHIIKHRGPDQTDVYISENISLGHRRLSIIDLSSQGRQPMSNEDESLWLTYNGEIYNFHELKMGLEAKGHVFKSHTDSEVILHAYEEKGLECVTDFRGMFAFAIWDTRKRRLILCRDRLGIKPLYYWWNGERLVFASEIKSIIQYHHIPREINLESFYTFLVFQYIPGVETAIKNIYKVPPGHMLILKDGELTLRKYWSIDDIGRESWLGNEQEATEKLSELVNESVALRLVSDVPLGVLLSGGLDSSSVVALMAQNTCSPIKTFSVGFGEPNDELKYASIVSQRFNTEHHEFLVKPRNLVDTLERIVWYLDEPLADGGAFATFLVSEVIKDYVKVVLVGEGADELFGGYSWHKLGNSYFSLLPQAIRLRLYFYLNTFHRASDDLGNKYGYFKGLFDNSSLGDKGLYAKMSVFEIKHLLPNCLLMKVDKMTMAYSLEARVPFLDHKLLEFVITLPANYKVRGFSGKYILRKVMQDKLPIEILKRKKRGFMIPLDKWMEDGLKEYAREVLLQNSAYAKQIIGKKRIESLFEPHRGLRGIESRLLLWRLLIFEVWHKFYIKDEEKACTVLHIPRA